METEELYRQIESSFAHLIRCFAVRNGLNGKWHCDRLSVAVVFNNAQLPKEACIYKLLIQTNSEECTVP